MGRTTMATTTGKSFLTGGGNALRGARNGSRLFMKQKYSLNVQIIPGERENFDVSEKRFDREVQSANIMRELRRRREFECTQTQKKSVLPRREKILERPCLLGKLFWRRRIKPFRDSRGLGVQVSPVGNNYSL